MTRQFDDESPVRSVRFDRVTHTLRVALESGASFDFADVPEHVYDELAHTPTPDAYFRANVCEEFIAVPSGDVDLAEMANERREDAVLGAPLAEPIPSSDGDAVAARTSRHTWVIDVIEEDAAAIEVDGRRVTPIPRWILPANASDGDVLRVTHGRSGSRSTLTIELDRDATRRANARSTERLRDVPSGGTGDITLGT